MKRLPILLVAPLLSGCAIGTVASAAVDVATLPVKAVSKTVDLATTSQSEADEKRGRALRLQDEQRARAWQAMAARCRAGRPIAGDDCSQFRPR